MTIISIVSKTRLKCIFGSLMPLIFRKLGPDMTINILYVFTHLFVIVCGTVSSMLSGLETTGRSLGLNTN